MTAIATVTRGPGAGFADPVIDAQAVFRGAMEAMSRPGRIVELAANPDAPTGLDTATSALALALFDHETPVWLGDGAARQAVYDYLRFHCGCPIVKSARSARFAIAVAAESVPSLDSLDPGSDAQPELSTTLILQVPAMAADEGMRLIGPGIAAEHRLRVDGAPAHFWRERKAAECLFPRGVDVFFTCGRRLAALPRTTRIEV